MGKKLGNGGDKYDLQANIINYIEIQTISCALKKVTKCC